MCIRTYGTTYQMAFNLYYFMWIYLQLFHLLSSSHSPHFGSVYVHSPSSMYVAKLIFISTYSTHITHTKKNFCFHEDRLKNLFHSNIARNPFLSFHSELGAFIIRNFCSLPIYGSLVLPPIHFILSLSSTSIRPSPIHPLPTYLHFGQITRNSLKFIETQLVP